MDNKEKFDLILEWKESKFLNLVSDIGISEIKCKEIFIQAITFTTYYNENKNKQVLYGENRVIAVIGDSILKAAISIRYYSYDKHIKSGKLTIDKSKVERNNKLKEIGINLNLEELFLYSNTDIEIRGMARGVEAVIGYIHMCYGFQYAYKFIELYIPD